MENRYNALRLHPADNIAVALRAIEIGETITIPELAEEVKAMDKIPYGHKMALLTIKESAEITKYGECMGIATEEIRQGGYVHVHNVRGLNEKERLNITSPLLNV